MVQEKTVKKYIQRPVVLIVPRLGGGTTRHVNEMAEAWSRQGYPVLFVEVYQRIVIVVVYEDKVGDYANQAYYYLPEQYDNLVAHLKMYKPMLIHYHHVMFYDKKVLSLLDDLEIPGYLTLHDYFVVCPSINLVNDKKIYCEEPERLVCEKCFKKINLSNSMFDLGNISSISEWRKNMFDFMRRMKKIFVPSCDEKKRMERYFPGLHFDVLENPEIVAIPRIVPKANFVNQKKCRVGVIGAISDEKGAKVIQQCLQVIEEKQMNIQIVVFGEIFRKIKGNQSKIKVLGKYDDQTIYELIQCEDIDFFWFPGQCPETYSYTLTIPIRLGIPVIASDIGAIGQRIKKNNWGSVYKWNLPAEGVCELLGSFDYSKCRHNKDWTCVNNTAFPQIEDIYTEIKKENIISPDVKKIHLESLDNLKQVKVVNSRGLELKLLKHIPLPFYWKFKAFIHMDYFWAIKRSYEKFFKRI